MKTRIFSIISCFICFWPIISYTQGAVESDAQEAFPYKLSEPSARYDLPEILEEVSALCHQDDKHLAMIQDELGRLYIFDRIQKKLVKEYYFRDHGDFEGVTLVGNTAYVLRSDGHIYELKEYASEEIVINKYKTFLSSENDAEGLCYDADNHRLLVACKSSPSYTDHSYKGNRAIYAFDLKTYQLTEEPCLLIDRKIIADKMGNPKQNFKPSGIAIHPISGDIYMTASSGQLLVVIDRNARIKWVKKLEKSIFRQPEGICFAPDGTMFIASEGVGEAGYVLEFRLIDG